MNGPGAVDEQFLNKAVSRFRLVLSAEDRFRLRGMHGIGRSAFGIGSPIVSDDATYLDDMFGGSEGVAHAAMLGGEDA